MRQIRITFISLVLAFSLASTASAQIEPEEAFPNLFSFTLAVDLQDPNDGTDRLFVGEQWGRIRVFQNDPAVTSYTTFLDISDSTYNFFAAGLQGFAFHPDYENNGYFYVCYNVENPERLRVSRFSVSAANPDSADASSELVLIEEPKVNYYHNGAALVFGPDDGYLYVSFGEDGVTANAQDRTNMFGSMIRIDVDTTSTGKNYGIPSDNPYFGNASGYAEEIYAYGLRNPWRFSIDPVTKKIWCGDVGAIKWEEIDIIESGGNYGWPILEGLECFEPAVCDTTGLGLTDPLYVYGHNVGLVIIGGQVYRGTRVPGLVGKYVYTDNFSGRLWLLDDSVTPPYVWPFYYSGGFNGITTFGVDKDNELFLMSYNGRIYWLTGDWPWVVGADTPEAGARLQQNYPNPFNPLTTIQYSVAAPANIEISVFDVAGRRVRTVVASKHDAGPHAVEWNGTDGAGTEQASGVYFYRLSVDGAVVETRRMVLLK